MNRESLWSIDQGGFTLRSPLGGRSYKNYLSNGDYGLCLDHRGTGYSVALSDGPGSGPDGGRCYVTHHGFGVMEKGRYLYCRDRDDGEVWNPSFAPCRKGLDRYECAHTPSSVTYTGALNGIACVSAHVLPETGRYELWHVSVTNESPRTRRISLMTRVEFLLQASYGVDFPYYSWYTDSRFDGSRSVLEIYSRKPAERPMLGFCRSLVSPTGYEASLATFIGSLDERNPESLAVPEPSSRPSAGDQPLAAFRWDVSLEPGEIWSTALCIGEGESSLAECGRRFPDLCSAAAWVERSRRPRGISAVTGGLPASRVGPETGRAWFEFFLPHQVRQQSLGMIRFAYRGYRDVAQDAMGMCQYEPAAARSLILDLAGMQHADGRCLRQFNTLGGSHDERDFRDLPFWLVLALARYIRAGGDDSILRERRPYLEGGEGATMLDHAARGLRYALRFGAHGLLEMGAGDWNDALSAFGTRGESLWLNQIAYLALHELSALALSDAERALFGFDFESVAERLYEGVIDGWTGEWFLRGYGDSGCPVGAGDRIFLLPQAWFTISGMSFRNPEKARIALDSMVSKLDHPDGLIKCHPPFTSYDPEVGNLSALTPGIAENFAVYNHASAFGIYALFTAGRETEARRYLERLLPYLKDHERTKSEPYALVNYYNGGFYPEREGRGGISWMTGTANWVSMIARDFLCPPDGGKRCNFPRGPVR